MSELGENTTCRGLVLTAVASALRLARVVDPEALGRVQLVVVIAHARLARLAEQLAKVQRYGFHLPLAHRKQFLVRVAP
jgi:hypothetical protein